MASESYTDKGTTITLSNNYVTDAGGNKYELRYDPKDGSTSLLRWNTTGNILFPTYEPQVILRTEQGSGYTYGIGSVQLDTGVELTNADGTTTTITKDNINVLLKSIGNDTKAAQTKLKAKQTAEGKSDVPPPVPTHVTENTPESQVIPPADPTDPADPTEPAAENNQEPTGNPTIDALGEAAQGVWRLYTKGKEGLVNAFPGVNNIKLDPEFQEKFGSNDKKTIVSYAQYPIDALYGRDYSGNMQDHVSIYQYSYKPPKKDLIFGKDGIGTLTDGVKRVSPLKDFIGLVKLPMPNDISDSNNISWGEDAMNNLSAAMTSAVVGNPVDVGLDAAALGAALAAVGVPGGMQLGAQLSMLGKASGGNISDGLGKIMTNATGKALAGSAFASRLLALGGVQVSPESILARGYGIVPNSNMELLFNAPTLRQFQFNWKMTARSKEEAFRIRQIIRFFKQGMAAKKVTGAAGGASTFLGTPNVFKLKYKTINDQDIEGVNRLKVCAVTGCSVNYTPGGSWSAYEDGQPVSTIMTLRMQELEPIFDTDYQEVTDGLFVGEENNTGNLDSIRGTRDSGIEKPYDVGY
jgi:hypothetical protein